VQLTASLELGSETLVNSVRGSGLIFQTLAHAAAKLVEMRPSAPTERKMRKALGKLWAILSHVSSIERICWPSLKHIATFLAL